MSLVVKIKGMKSHEYKLRVQEDSTVKELTALVSQKEKCHDDQVKLTRDGFPLGDDQTMKGLGAAFLAAPVLDLLIMPDMNTIQSLKFEPTDEDSEMSIRFPIGTWVETKIKGSVLIESDDNMVNEWCLGKVVEHTGSGYLLEIFENYKFLMPPKIEAAYNEVRIGRQHSVDLARRKSDEDFKYDIRDDVPEEKKTEAPRRSSRTPKPKVQAHRSTQSALFKKGRRKPGLTTPVVKKRRSWSAGQRRRSKQNLLGVSEDDLREDYKSKVKEYTEKYPSMDPSDVRMYVRVFRSELDKRRRGVITKTVLKRWIKANKIDLEESTIDELLATLDLKDAKVSMDNFINIMCSSSKAKPKTDETRELFNKFDLDGDAVISKSELKAGMKNIFGQDMSEDKLTQMIKEADSTGLGTINFEDFSKMMKR